MNTPDSAMSPSTPTRTVAGAGSGAAAGLAAGAAAGDPAAGPAPGAADAAGEGVGGGAGGGVAGTQASPSSTLISEPLSRRARSLMLPSSGRSGAVRPSAARGPTIGAIGESPWPSWRNRTLSIV